MDINEAKNVAEAIIGIHQGVLESNGWDGTDDEITIVRGRSIDIALRGASEFLDVDVTMAIDGSTTIGDMLAAMRAGFEDVDAHEVFDDMVLKGWKNGGASPSRTLREMEDDEDILQLTKDGLTMDAIRSHMDDGHADWPFVTVL